MTDKIIVITTVHDLTNAYLIKNILESNGIECFIANENTITADPLYMNAVGGMKIHIREEDRKLALQLLSKNENSQIDDPTNVIEEANTTETICPNCSSSDVRREKVSIASFAISFLLLGFPIPFLKRKYHCFNCQHEWK